MYNLNNSHLVGKQVLNSIHDARTHAYEIQSGFCSRLWSAHFGFIPHNIHIAPNAHIILHSMGNENHFPEVKGLGA